MQKFDKDDKEFLDIISYYKSEMSGDSYQALVNLLKDINHLYGFIPLESVEIICDEFKLKESYLMGIIKKNSRFLRFVKNSVTVCTGPRCMNKNSYSLLKYLENKYNTESGSNDNLDLNISTKNCMHKCGTSPNMVVNDVHYGNVSLEDLDKILKENNI